MSKKRIFAIAMALMMLLTAIPAVAAQGSVSVADARLIKYDGNETESLKAGDMYAEFDLVNSGDEQSFMFTTVLFEKGVMIDVDYQEITAAKGESTIQSAKLYVPKASGDYEFKAFLWTMGMEPLSNGIVKGVYQQSQPTDINGATVTIGNFTYNGIVDNENKKIAFYVPVYQSVGSTKHRVLKEGITAAEFDAAVLSLTPVFNTTASVADAQVAKDFRKPVKYTVSAEGKTKEYTVEIFETVVQHGYGFDGEKYTTAASRNELPAWHSSMVGSSSWFWSTSYDSRVTTSFDDESGNRVFTINKTVANAASDFRSASGAPLFGIAQAITSYKVKFDSISDGGGVYIGGSSADGNYSGRGAIVFTRAGKADGDTSIDLKFMKTPADTAKTVTIPGESVTLGQWNEITTIEKNTDNANGKYDDIFEIYINGKYIASFSGEYDTDLGFNAVHTGFYSYTDTTFKMSIDDYNVQYTFGTLVTESTKTSGGSVYTGARYPKADEADLFIMGDSIVTEYNPSYAPLQGWSAPLRGMFSEDINWVNTALSGHKTAFYFEGDESRSWPVTYRFMKRYLGEGDYILLMLGPNESDMEVFQQNLEKIARDALYYGAKLVFVTPTVYATYNPITNTGYTYSRIMKAAAEEVAGTEVIDLNSKLYEVYSGMDIDELREKYFVGTKRGASESSPDYGHNVEAGALLIASLIRELIDESDLGLKEYLLPAAEKEITSFGVEIDGKTFYGNIAGDNIFVDVPVKQATTATTYKDYGVSESKYDEGISSVSVHVTAKGTVADAGKKYDFTKPQKFTVTATDGTERQYTVYVNKVVVQHAYGFAGKLYSGASSRNYTPAWDSTMIGSSMWGWNDYSHNSENIGLMIPDPDNSENQVYSVEKTSGSVDASFRSYSGAPDMGVKGLTTSYRVRFEYLNGDMYIGGAGAKETSTGQVDMPTGRHALVFTREGKADGDKSIDLKYVKTPDSTQKVTLTSAPKLNVGEWISVTTIQENKENGLGGYTGTMYIIVNGKYVGKVEDTYYRDFALKALHTGFMSGEGSTYKVLLDDYSVSYVDGRENTSGTQLYILGDAIGKSWGDKISKNFSSSIEVKNEALAGYTLEYYVNGSADKNFSPKFEYIQSGLDSGDYVMIALGKYESDAEAFATQLGTVIDAVKAKGATPMLVTPTVSYAQTPANDTAAIAQIIKTVASEKEVDCIDLNSAMFAYVSGLSGADYKALYSADTLTLSDAGSDYVVNVLYELINSCNNPLKESLVAGAEKKIETASITLGSYTYEGIVNETEKKITFYVPTQYYHTSGNRTYGIGDDAFNAAIKSVVPIFGSKGEVIDADVAQDFSTGAKTYTVKALDGTSVNYTVSVEKSIVNYTYDFRTNKLRTDSWGKNLPAWGDGVTGVNTWYWCALANNAAVTDLAGIKADPADSSNLTLKVAKVNGTDNANFFSTDGGITSGIKKAITEYKVKFTALSATCGEETSNGVFIGGAGGTIKEGSSKAPDPETGRPSLVFTRAGKSEDDNTIDVKYIANGSETATQQSFASAPTIALNTWHNVKYVHTNTALGEGGFSGVTEIYLDGVHIGSVTGTYANDYSLHVAQIVFGSYNTVGTGLTTFEMYVDNFTASYIK